VTREGIRQIEVQALRKLRHPSRSQKLRDDYQKWVDNGFKPVQADRNDSYEDEEVVALAPDPRIKGRVPVREVH
jgi:hypothetical protein